VSLELYAHTCGFLTIPRGFLLEAAEGWITVPIPSYLIVHPAGKVLFDSGLNIRTQTDPEPYIGRVGSKYATFHFRPGEEVAARLTAMSVAPEEITCIVNSHLHYDHCGGNVQLPNADVVVYGISVVSRLKPEFLREMTTLTGGRLFEIEKTANLASTFLGILDEFRQRYLVSYTPKGVAKDGWHKLEVRVKNRRATVKARPGYLAGS